MRQWIHNNQSVMLRLFHKTLLRKTAKKVAHASSSWASDLSVARAYPFFPFLWRNICYLIKAILNPCRSFIIYHLTYKVYINICYWKPFNFHAFRYKICLSACVDALPPQLASHPRLDTKTTTLPPRCHWWHTDVWSKGKVKLAMLSSM